MNNSHSKLTKECRASTLSPLYQYVSTEDKFCIKSLATLNEQVLRTVFVVSSSMKLILVMSFSALFLFGASLPGILSSGPFSEDTTPAPDELEQLTEHVLLIVVDGVPRTVFDDSEMMPFLASFDSYGVKIPVETSELTLTGACVKEMATGRHASPLDAIRNWEVTNEVKNDPFYHAAFRGDSVAFSGFYVWNNLYPDAMFTHRTSADYGFEDIREADNEALAVVDEWLESSEHHLMVSHLGGTDHAAHIYGLESTKYKERMQELDGQLEAIFRNAPENWTVILTADHGLTKYGGHALGTGAVAEEVYLFAHGQGIRTPIALNEPMEQRDISMLLSALLKLDLPVTSDAKIPIDALDVDAEQQVLIEQWNWMNVLAYNDLVEEEFGTGLQGLSEQPDWDELGDDIVPIPLVPLLLTTILTCLIFFAMYRLMPTGLVSVISGRIQIASLLAFAIGLYLFLFELRDASEDFSGRWIRKILGSFPVLLIALYFIVNKNFRHRNEVPLLIVGLSILLFFYPEMRFSMITIAAAPLGIYLVKMDTERFTTSEKGMLSVFFFLYFYQLIDYLPRFFTGLSLQALVNIDLLYKPMQRIVLSSIPSSLVSSFLIVTLFAFLLNTKKDDMKFKTQWPPIAVLLSIFILSAVQSTIFDWVLISMMMLCAIVSFLPDMRTWIRVRLGHSPSEIILLAWVGPTWGYFPAFTALLFGRTLPKLIAMIDASSFIEQSSLHNRVAKATLAISLLYCIWFNFSLLTPLGLLEFNPSKVIVTGGFFGARSDPSIAWMGMMILFPPLYALGFMLYRLGEEVGLDDTLFLISFFLLSHAASYWAGLYFTEYFVMLSTASLFYGAILILGAITTVLLNINSSTSMAQEID